MQRDSYCSDRVPNSMKGNKKDDILYIVTHILISTTDLPEGETFVNNITVFLLLIV